MDDGKSYDNQRNAYKALSSKQTAIQDYQKAANLYQRQGKTKDYQDALNQIKTLQ